MHKKFSCSGPHAALPLQPSALSHLAGAASSPDLVLLHGSSHICRVDPPVVQIGKIPDVGQNIAAVLRIAGQRVACQIDHAHVLELAQVGHVVKLGDLVAP